LSKNGPRDCDQGNADRELQSQFSAHDCHHLSVEAAVSAA
jgi:hypothetical protein